MVKLKSFKTIERPDETVDSGGKGGSIVRKDQSRDQSQSDGSNRLVGTKSGQILAQQEGSNSPTRSMSIKSTTSSKCSSAVIGGNLTSDTSSRASVISIKLASAAATPIYELAYDAEAEAAVPAAVDVAAAGTVASDIQRPAPASNDGSITLSSNEEFQSAQIDLNDEDEATLEARGSKEENIDPGRPRENVTKIEIEHNNSTPSLIDRDVHRSPLITTAMRLQHITMQQQQKANQNSPLTTPKLVRAPNMPRSQTSPSPLSQMVGKLPQMARGSGGKLAAGSLAMDDSASQFSLQYKYQGSNQFEIRWLNVSLFARPKSRVPNFVSDNCLYRALFPAANSAATNKPDSDLPFDDPYKPPYSPPLKHYKIPPTIDENLEMKCSADDEKVGTSKSIVAASSSSSSTTASSSSSPDLPMSQSPQPLVQSPLPPLFAQISASNATSTSDSPSARCILNNISGQVFSGQMTAILGPSGVGKTSLLNSLTGRNTLDGTGRVSLIGANNSKRMSVVTVPQVDVLPNKLTTYEDLHFTSRLKNPQSRFDHQRNIDRLVKHLHMDKFLHTKIDKLSGGEARRLSIARELLSSPDIMILDEPTSGLDANTCKKIIIALRDIVEHSDNILDKPMSIIITIHQPQQEVYQLFHRVYVMAIGGRVVYEGSPQLLMPTILEHSSIGRFCSVDQLNENPAIVAIEVASGEHGSQVIEELAIYHEGQICEELGIGGGGPTESPMLTPRSLIMHKSPMSVSRFDVQLHRRRLNSLGDSSIGRPTPILAKRHHGHSQCDHMSSITSLSYASTYDADLPEQTSKLKVDKRLRRSVVMKSHFVSHTLTLIRRCWLLTTRDIFLMSIRIIGFLLVAAGTVQIFSHALDPAEHQCPLFESEIDDMPVYLSQMRNRLVGLFDMLRQGNSTHLFFFHLLLCITMVTSALTGLMFPLQMRMFIREYKNGWYSPASFIMSQTIAELPADIIGPLITLLITYPLCHQPDSIYHWRPIAYVLVVVLTSIICKSQAQIVGAFLMDSVENSVFISCVAVTPPALLSGIPLRIEQMITPLKLVSYTSFLRYAFESLLELRYGFGMCPCDPSIVDGPLRASRHAVPAHLENLATGLLELNLPSNTTTPVGDGSDKALASTSQTPGESEHANVFLKFLRLITDASNMFTSNSEINDCNQYRSLYLINMGIQNNTFIDWIVVMVLMLIISRFLTYFAVKTVIRLRRN